MSVQDIKKEALKQFAEKGYESTSIKDITRIIGMTPPALYAHFASKEELFLEIYKECNSDLVDGIKRTIDKNKNESGCKVLRYIYECYLEFYMEHSSKTIFLLRNQLFPPIELKERLKSVLIDTHSDVRKVISGIFADCIEKGIIKNMPLKAYHSSFYRLVNSYVFEIMALDKLITKEEMNCIWEYYWNSIKNEV